MSYKIDFLFRVGNFCSHSDRQNFVGSVYKRKCHSVSCFLQHNFDLFLRHRLLQLEDGELSYCSFINTIQKKQQQKQNSQLKNVMWRNLRHEWVTCEINIPTVESFKALTTHTQKYNMCTCNIILFFFLQWNDTWYRRSFIYVYVCTKHCTWWWRWLFPR